MKKQILELKRQTSKLRKRNLDQKSEKKRISKEIKQLRENMRKCGIHDEVNEEDDNEADQWEDVTDYK